jgi:hypothetical protein
MIERLALRKELALGFSSSTLGAYDPEQTLIDISAGSRTWKSLYDGDLPRLALARSASHWRLAGWDQVLRRARTPPAEIEPGSLAEAVQHAGGTVAYLGIDGRLNREAAVAADRQGRVRRAALVQSRRSAAGVSALWRGSSLLVIRLPAGPDTSSALSALLAARRPSDLVMVLQQPQADPRRLLALGAVGLGNGRSLKSGSTRTDGLVVNPDVAATALDFLSIPLPKHMQGRPIEASGDRSVAELIDLKDRLAEVGPRRWSLTLLGLAGAVVLAGLSSALLFGPSGRGALRLALLAALWLPTVLLVTGALSPSWVAEVAIVAVAAGALAVATDRLLPAPVAIAVPAGVTLLAQCLDLAFGSPLTERSLLGPNPILGARFYGVGNELEVTLAITGLLGLGAALARAPRETRAWGFAIGGAALAFLLSWGRLGADVGASVMLAAGAATAVVVSLGGPVGRSRALAVFTAPVVAVGALALLDLATGGDAHLTRSVLRAGGLNELGDIAQRRFELSYHSLRGGSTPFLFAPALAALVAGVRMRQRLLAPLASFPGLRAGIAGAFVAVIAGALANDSGPIILLMGTAYLGLAIAYVQGLSRISGRSAA